MTHDCIQSDCLDFLRQLPESSADLVFGSPPYEQARLYLEGGVNLGVSRKTDAWVAWMADVYEAAQRACKGLVAFVVAGQTRNYRWSAGPALLMAELHRRGMNLRNPPIFSRVGIPGSGGPDWLRGDYEWIVCTSRPGKLPWSDNTACGHTPKWAPGGEMSHRVSDGSRVNQWGHPIDSGATVVAADGVVTSEGKRPSHRLADDPWGKRGRGNNIGGYNGKDERNVGTVKKARLRVKGGSPKDSCRGRRVPAGTTVNGELLHEEAYLPPVLANPGNEVQQTYQFTTEELTAMLAEQGDIQRFIVGGGVMGNELCHENEAPFPEKLAEFFVLSFCTPGGTVVDCFSGSGTTAAMCKKHGRNFTGCDLRQSQVDLTMKRLGNESQLLFS